LEHNPLYVVVELNPGCALVAAEGRAAAHHAEHIVHGARGGPRAHPVAVAEEQQWDKREWQLPHIYQDHHLDSPPVPARTAIRKGAPGSSAGR
jgi:hypothetical protein